MHISEVDEVRNSWDGKGEVTTSDVEPVDVEELLAIPIPDEIRKASEADVEQMLEVDAAGTPISLVGSAPDRIGVLTADQVQPAPERSTAGPLDWSV